MFSLLITSCLDCNRGGVLGTLPGLLGLIQATEMIKWILQLGKSLQQKFLIVDY